MCVPSVRYPKGLRPFVGLYSVVVVVVRSRKVFCTLTPEERSEANEARWWDGADGFGMVAAARPTLDPLSFVERQYRYR